MFAKQYTIFKGKESKTIWDVDLESELAQGWSLTNGEAEAKAQAEAEAKAKEEAEAKAQAEAEAKVKPKAGK